MKIRTDFVTNSSSSSFIAFGIGDDEIAHFIKSVLGGKTEAFSNYQVGSLRVFNGVTSVTTTLDYGRFYVHNQDGNDNRSNREIEADNREAKKVHNILPALLAFLPRLSNNQESYLEKLVKAAADRGGTFAEVYIDETDGFCDRSYDWGDFSSEAATYVPDHFELSGGKLISYDESKIQLEDLFLPHSITELSREVFKGCKFKSIAGSARMQEPGIFIDCKNLENIEFFGNPYVPENTFKGCESLKSVTLPNKIYGIERGAFAGCKNLESINIPTTLAFVEEGAFDDCDALAQKKPELWSRICALGGSKAEFEKKIGEVEHYIHTHGGASFKPDKYNKIESVIVAKKNYELWHSIYDSYIDEIVSLDHRMKFAVLADPNHTKEILSSVSDELNELHWKQVKSISEFTNILVVETDEIYQFDRFVKKQEYIQRGWVIPTNFGVSLLERAVEIKKSGGTILIITLNNLLELLTKRAFAEDLTANATKNQREAKKAEKQESRANDAEELIAQIVRECSVKSCFLSIDEINEKVDAVGLSRAYFSQYISEKYGKTPHKFFEEANVIRTSRHDFNDTLAVLKKRYETRARVYEVSQLISENADLDFSIIANNAKKFTNMTARELLLSEGILAVEEVPSQADLFVGVLHMPGNEPDNIKRRLATLFAKLNEAYPDKVIEGLNRDHKKWGETVTELYRLLGYANSRNFLMAYGYTVADNKGGRTANDAYAVIEELKKRYPNGSFFTTVAALKEQNPDISGKIKSIENKSTQLFGMPLGKYLKSIGILGGVSSLNSEDSSKEIVSTLNQEADSNTQGLESEKPKNHEEAECERQNRLEEDYRKVQEATGSRIIDNVTEDVVDESKIKTAEPSEQSYIEHPQKQEHKPTVDTTTTSEEDFVIYRGILKQYNGKASDIVIPETVTKIGERAFKDNKKLKAVALHDGIVRIDGGAFWGCTSLQSIVIPDSVAKIDWGAFNECSALKEVTIGKGVTNIGERAFRNCKALKNLVVSDTVTYFGVSAFDGCGSLTISGYADSAAEKYANKNGIKFIRMTADNKFEIQAQSTDSTSDKDHEKELRRIREDNERRVREDQEREARIEAERKANEEEERQKREAEEAIRKAREAEQGKALEETYRKAQEDAERRKREVVLRQAHEEAERKKREEIERICREAEERRLRAEAERKAQEEAERKAREEERKARAEAERKAREEEERKAKEEAERKEREKEKRKAAREEAKRKAREEEERKAREEAERLEQERIRAERRAKKLCQHCGGSFKGLFTKKCSNCGMKKDY